MQGLVLLEQYYTEQHLKRTNRYVMFVCVHACVCVYVYVCVYMCVRVCVCVCVCV